MKQRKWDTHTDTHTCMHAHTNGLEALDPAGYQKTEATARKSSVSPFGSVIRSLMAQIKEIGWLRGSGNQNVVT